MIKENGIFCFEPFKIVILRVMMTEVVNGRLDTQSPIEHIEKDTLPEVMIDIEKVLNVSIIEEA